MTSQHSQPTTAPSHPYTCLACSLAFTTAHTQRTHYATDLHRYNAKRRVVGLDPLDSNAFDTKLLDRQTPVAPPVDPSSRRCEPCNKTFASQGAERSHLTSRRHKQIASLAETVPVEASQINPSKTSVPNISVPSQSTAEGAAVESLIAARLARAPRIPDTDCLFCPRRTSFDDVDAALAHMLTHHGFFIPERDFLVDRAGLLAAIAERISVWNVCLYCGTGFGGTLSGSDDTADRQEELARLGLERVRKHMCDKAHCKIAWDNEEDRLEYAEFFDYRSSHKQLKADGGEAEWEDVSSDTSDAAMDVDEESDELPPALSFGDSAFELVLPNGTRIGHRALRHIYKQNLLPYAIGSQAVKTGSNMKLITQLARLALVPARGGGSPSGGELVQARNRGEAREAGRHIREFRDAHRRELFKTRVGCTSGNNQKHYRDPLLQ